MEDSGSYMRFTSDHSFPSTRPHNKNLAKLVVQSSQLTRHDRNVKIRPSNLQAKKYEYKRTLFDRDPNVNVRGGKLRHPGWDPRHPRLSRDPTWYPGRGLDKAKKVVGIVGSAAKDVASVAKDVAPLVAV